MQHSVYTQHFISLKNYIFRLYETATIRLHVSAAQRRRQTLRLTVLTVLTVLTKIFDKNQQENGERKRRPNKSMGKGERNNQCHEHVS
jgi:hypothetical protein